ncbi:MAG: hypothetical protein OXM02_12160 [Bacteroidota bacterium]|nr:hypothetical protein [Bacteroidota bacterium]
MFGFKHPAEAIVLFHRVVVDVVDLLVGFQIIEADTESSEFGLGILRTQGSRS